MNQRMLIQLEAIKSERTFTFAIPYGAPYEDAYEVITQMAETIKIAMEENKKLVAAKQQEAQKTEEK